MREPADGCPICNRALRKTSTVLVCQVPDGASDGQAPPGAKVLGRSKMYREGTKIVQDVKIWDGGYSSDWPPFCSITCAARMGVEMWKSGVRPNTPLSLEAPERKAIAGAESWNALAQKMIEPSPSGTAAIADMRPVEEPDAAYEEGHPLWHPDKNKPPPVPGVFRYGKWGRIVSTTPEAIARKHETAKNAREARLAIRAGKQTPKVYISRESMAAYTYGAVAAAKKHFNLTEEEWYALSRAERDSLRFRIITLRKQGKLPMHAERHRA